MPIDIDAAQRFVLTNARLLDRHRLAVIVRGAPVEPVLAALRAYRNPDGGFGHALEPDIRDPASQPASTLHALEVLAGVGALDDRMVSEAAAWVASTAEPDGGVPMALPTAAAHPRAPWMSPSSGGSFLTFALAARLREAGSQEPWLDRATDWCWAELERADELSANGVKFALDFLDTVPDEPRARAAVERLRSRLEADGSIPVSGGLEDERITPLALSERPEGRSRALFTDVQIDADLDRIESGQQDDGGWTFDWAAWSPGQSVEWRGAMTLWVLAVLRAHGRIDVPLGDRP
jgi:hypothetical protein